MEFFIGNIKTEMASQAGATFGTWDYVVLIAMLLISSGIGLYYRFTGGKQKTLQVCIIIKYYYFETNC